MGGASAAAAGRGCRCFSRTDDQGGGVGGWGADGAVGARAGLALEVVR